MKGGFMSSRDLPARPSLDHLKNEAKALHKAFDQGDPDARRRIHERLGDESAIKLSDAQRVIAREYGFPNWARLRDHVRSFAGGEEAVASFLAAVNDQDMARAKRVLREHPAIARESLHVASVLGLVDEVRRLIAENPARVTERAGSSNGVPLLYLCYSPFHGESAERDAGLLATARVLLDAGSDPNTKDSRYHVPALYAVTGLRSVLPIARLLLDAGANPTDEESVFHAAERFHKDALELLLQAGAKLDFIGEWGNTAIYFLLRWHDLERETPVRQGVEWLLEHGADPNVRSGKERETALHIAARRGQSPGVIKLLLDHGADVNATRDDGSTAWLLARRGAFDAAASLLEAAGATTSSLSPLDLMLEACARGDVDAARRLGSPELVNALAPSDRLLLPEAAAEDRNSTVLACLAAGYPVDTTDSVGATALHHATIRGRVSLTRLLLDAGADISIRDSEHSSTPLGWALFGSDISKDSDADYEATVRALLEKGARPRSDEYMSRRPGVRAVLRKFGVTSGHDVRQADPPANAGG
jgi:ankyrin repeat protein